MKRLMLVLVVFALGLQAAAREPQEPTTEKAAPEAAAESAGAPDKLLISAPEPQAENPKLRLGHPLDPADVAILTGKSGAGSGQEGYSARAAVVLDMSAGPLYGRGASLLNPFRSRFSSRLWLADGPPLFFLRGRHPSPWTGRFKFD